MKPVLNGKLKNNLTIKIKFQLNKFYAILEFI